MADPSEKVPLLQMKNIHKWFGKVHALKGVDLTVDAGEVVAVIGDNGAGKSTLIKILVGLFPMNSGSILWEGKEVAIKSIADSRKLGIEPVYQTQAVVDCLSVADNVFLGREPVKKLGPFSFVDKKAMTHHTDELTKKLGLRIATTDQEVRFCSGGERQGVAIARAMHHQASLTILDEPVTALSMKGTSQVMEFVRQLKQKDIGVIIIEHNIAHAHSVADRFVIMSRGKVKVDITKEETTLSALEDMMMNL